MLLAKVAVVVGKSPVQCISVQVRMIEFGCFVDQPDSLVLDLACAASPKPEKSVQVCWEVKTDLFGPCVGDGRLLYRGCRRSVGGRRSVRSRSSVDVHGHRRFDVAGSDGRLIDIHGNIGMLEGQRRRAERDA